MYIYVWIKFGKRKHRQNLLWKVCLLITFSRISKGLSLMWKKNGIYFAETNQQMIRGTLVVSNGKQQRWSENISVFGSFALWKTLLLLYKRKTLPLHLWFCWNEICFRRKTWPLRLRIEASFVANGVFHSTVRKYLNEVIIKYFGFWPIDGRDWWWPVNVLWWKRFCGVFSWGFFSTFILIF